MTVTSATSAARDARREELLALLRECDVDADGPLEDETPLISSGLLDSLGLFRVALWVEEQTGRPIDPATFDLAQEWDSIGFILDFIDRAARRGNGVASHGPAVRSVARTSHLRIIRYTPDYKRAVAELQTDLWCADPQRNLGYLEWKYERNPCPAGSHIYLALDGDDVVGMRGFHPSGWESNSFKSRDFLVADDTVVRADHRNKGVMNHIMREALHNLHEQDVDYVFNFSGGPITVISSLAAGWRSIGAVDPLHHRSRTARLMDSVASIPFAWRFASSVRSLSRSQSDPFHRIDRLLETTLTARGTQLRISRRAEPERMAQLVRNVPHDGRIRLARDAAYLKWRFENPLNDYRFFYLERDGLDGYLVVKRSAARANGEASPTVHIVDLEARDENSKLALLEAAAARDFFDVLVVWSVTLSKPCKDFLASIKYDALTTSSALQGHPSMLVRATDDARLDEEWRLRGMSLTDMTNWDMRMIYSMSG